MSIAARHTLLSAFVLFATVACGHRYAVTGSTLPDGSMVEFQPDDVHVVFATMTADEAALALSEGLRDRNFNISEMSPGVIVASTSSRRLNLTVAINYDARGAVIRYIHSDGMRVETDVSSRCYDTLTRRLSDAIQHAVARPGRERADHELALARARRPALVAPAPVAGIYLGGVGGGAYLSGGVVAGAPMVSSCGQSVERYGHSRGSAIHCGGADPWCADALLRMGHHPTSLLFCRDVEPSCAVRLLEEGRNPTALSRCR